MRTLLFLFILMPTNILLSIYPSICHCPSIRLSVYLSLIFSAFFFPFDNYIDVLYSAKIWKSLLITSDSDLKSLCAPPTTPTCVKMCHLLDLYMYNPKANHSRFLSTAPNEHKPFYENTHVRPSKRAVLICYETNWVIILIPPPTLITSTQTTTPTCGRILHIFYLELTVGLLSCSTHC